MEKQSDSLLKERNADISDNEMQVVVNLQRLNQ